VKEPPGTMAAPWRRCHPDLCALCRAVTSVRMEAGTDNWAIYAAGGADCNGDASAVVERYDVADRKWEPVEQLSFARKWLGLTAISIGNSRLVPF
jgi:hypothetical protein